MFSIEGAGGRRGEAGVVKVRILEPPCFLFYDWLFFTGWELQLVV